MPKRDVVLAGILAFGAGVAVGANWKKLGKKAAPLLEQLGLKMSDLADFLAEVTEEAKTEPKPAKPPPCTRLQEEDLIFRRERGRVHLSSSPQRQEWTRCYGSSRGQTEAYSLDCQYFG